MDMKMKKIDSIDQLQKYFVSAIDSACSGEFDKLFSCAERLQVEFFSLIDIDDISPFKGDGG